MIFRFANPELLGLLVLVPIFLLLRGKTGRAAAVKFPSIQLAKQVAAFVRSRPGRFAGWLRALVLTCLIVALARPQFGEETSDITQSGIDIVLAVDLSTSMWAHDFEMSGLPVDRLTVVRRVLEDFIERRPSDRLGLIAFSGEAFLVSPLTLKHDWLSNRLEELEIGMLPDGTAIGSAIGTSVNRLVDQESKSKIIILLTDGENNTGVIDPLPAAEAAKAFGIKIYTIGVGRVGNVPYPRTDRFGNFVRDRNGRPLLSLQQSQIDLESLQEIAKMTEGRYYHATDTDQLEAIYDEIDELEKTEITLTVNRLYDDMFWIPLALAAALFALEQILAQTRLRRLP
jgi:Ca-activated chloride channel family protein